MGWVAARRRRDCSPHSDPCAVIVGDMQRVCARGANAPLPLIWEREAESRCVLSMQQASVPFLPAV